MPLALSNHVVQKESSLVWKDTRPLLSNMMCRWKLCWQQPCFEVSLGEFIFIFLLWNFIFVLLYNCFNSKLYISADLFSEPVMKVVFFLATIALSHVAVEALVGGDCDRFRVNNAAQTETQKQDSTELLVNVLGEKLDPKHYVMVPTLYLVDRLMWEQLFQPSL